MYEHVYGKQAFSENLEYSLHIVEDIKRHSTVDNYWCYVFERFVKFHNAQTTNQKQLCKTLSDRIHQLQFVQHCLEVKEKAGFLLAHMIKNDRHYLKFPIMLYIAEYFLGLNNFEH